MYLIVEVGRTMKIDNELLSMILIHKKSIEEIYEYWKSTKSY
jgi:hypothetical protein